METNNNSEHAASLLQVKQVAAMLGVSQRTVWRMIADGQLKAVRVRRCTRLLLAEVMEYMNGGSKVGCL
jgi:excisionase family DNA binding protein